MEPITNLLEQIEREYSSISLHEAEILLGLLLVPDIEPVSHG